MQFDAEEHKDTGFEAIPKGNYRVMIEKVEQKTNSKGTGSYLQFELIVRDGTYAGRRLWYRCTVEHSESEAAVKIGLGQLSALSRSVGRPKWRSERELVGLEGEVIVGIDKEDQTRNDVKGWVVRDRAQQTAPAGNPHKSAHYGGAAAAPPHHGPPPSAGPRPGAPGVPGPRSQGYPAQAPQGYPQSPYPEMPRRGMSQPAPAPAAPPPEAYDYDAPPAYDDGVPF